ncbi:hypothetical protein TNCV_2205781 [Trichonephila clavipes]|nr:hypothetical protein TNCV_2205781 [Trichonephila clavipes]
MKVTERLPPMSGGANVLNIQQMQQLSLHKTRCLLIKQVRSVSWGKNYQNEMKVRIVPNSTAAASPWVAIDSALDLQSKGRGFEFHRGWPNF